MVRERVTAELRLGRSPEAIWADMAAENVPGRVRPETIYIAVYTRILDVTARECLRSRRPRRRHRQQRCASKRAGLPNIAARPQIVNERGEAGHWEADGIIGARNRSNMLWLTERASRFSIPVTMPVGYTAQATLAGLVEAFEQIPAHASLGHLRPRLGVGRMGDPRRHLRARRLVL